MPVAAAAGMRLLLAAIASAALLLAAPVASADGTERHSPAMRTTGIALTAAGATAVAAGAGLVVFAPEGGSDIQCVRGPCGGGPSKDPAFVVAGVAAAGTGVAMLAVGIPLWIAGASPREKPASPSASLSLSGGPGSVRLAGAF